MNDPIDWLERIIQRRRQYATFFDFPDVDARDAGNTCDLLDSLPESEAIPVCPGTLRARGKGNDPPDCEAQLIAGGKIGFELTELVDEESIRRQIERGSSFPFDYTNETFIERLQARLDAKVRQREALKGGPYALLVLIIYTDEMLLMSDECRNWIEGTELRFPEPWDRVFIIFPPRPRLESTADEGPKVEFIRLL
jgi:hypothetical protein